MLVAFTFLLDVHLLSHIPSLTREQYRLHSFSRWLSYASARLLKIMCKWSVVHFKDPPTAFPFPFFDTNFRPSFDFLIHP
jgi:hypothetical protein